MDNCCAATSSAQSWIDWIHASPATPLSLIVNAQLGATVGAFVNSTNYNTGTLATNAVVIQSGQTPQVTALQSDNLGMVADAAQWNFQHLTANTAATLPAPLLKVLFMRAGSQWANTIPFNLGGSTFTNVQLGFRDNAATRGDAQATYPVIQWTGSFTGNTPMLITFTTGGRYSLMLRCDTGSAVQYSEWEVVLVP
jgi:hypothetical protein